MSFDYLNEAFKKLSILDEDVFSTSSPDLVRLSNKLDDTRDDYPVKVFDLEAENETELQSSYIGKVIVNCNVCHSHVFMNKEDIVITDEGDVNTDTQCPYCGETSGFAIVGEVTPYVDDTNKETVVTVDGEEVVPETAKETSTPVTESVRQKRITEGKHAPHTMRLLRAIRAGKSAPVRESVEADKYDYDDVKKFLEAKGFCCTTEAAMNYIWSVVDYLATAVETDPDYDLEQWYKDTSTNYPEDLETLKCEEPTPADVTIPAPYDKYMQIDDYQPDPASGEYCVGDIICNHELLAYLSPKPEYEETFDSWPMLFRHVDSGNIVVAEVAHDRLYHYDLEMFGINESVENVNVKTSDQELDITSGENGELTVSTKPVEPTFTDDEAFGPLGDDTFDSIGDNNDLVDEDEEDLEVEEVEEEDKELETEDDADEGEELEIEEVDDESLGNLGESYLRDVYSNVNSFKVNKISSDDTKLIVEGVITFESGAKKSTGFEFTPSSMDTNGVVKFTGSNKQLTEDVNAYVLTGKLVNKKLLPEKLVYNYSSKEGSNKVQGIASRKG